MARERIIENEVSLSQIPDHMLSSDERLQKSNMKNSYNSSSKINSSDDNLDGIVGLILIVFVFFSFYGMYKFFFSSDPKPNQIQQTVPQQSSTSITKEQIENKNNSKSIVNDANNKQNNEQTTQGNLQPPSTSSSVSEQFSSQNNNSTSNNTDSNQGISLLKSKIKQDAELEKFELSMSNIYSDTSIKRNRKVAREYNKQGIVHEQAREWAQAEMNFKLAHEEDPLDVEILNNLAMAILCGKDDAHTSLNYSKKSLSLKGNIMTSWLHNAQIQGALNNELASLNSLKLAYKYTKYSDDEFINALRRLEKADGSNDILKKAVSKFIEDFKSN